MSATYEHYAQQKVTPGPVRTKIAEIGVNGSPRTAIEIVNIGSVDIAAMWIGFRMVHKGNLWADWLTGAFGAGGYITLVQGSSLGTLPAGETGAIEIDTRGKYSLLIEAICTGSVDAFPKISTEVRMRGYSFINSHF